MSLGSSPSTVSIVAHRPQSSRARTIAIAILAANLLLIFLFPPYDYLALQHGNIPTFEGFRFFFSTHPNRHINSNFLWLEVIVVLINFFIALLLLRERRSDHQHTTNRAQRWLLSGVAINLSLLVLFPPFENFTAITKAALPTFEGFFFIFGDNQHRQIVTAILYLEVAVLLINAGLLWLYLKDRPTTPISAQRMGELARSLQSVQKP